MKNIKQYYLFLFFLSGIVNAQNGLGTPTPDASSILDLSSTSKGLLLPRMTSEQRDSIQNPANGLVIFNTSTNLFELNSGTPVSKNWITISEISMINSGYDSINAIGEVTTDSTQQVLAPEMTVTPSEGSYAVSFESQYNNSKVDVTTVVTTGGVSSAQGVADLQSIYDQLNVIPANNTTHNPVFGNSEVLTPGVYSIATAVSILQTLTLDGQNDPDSVFVFKITGALNTGAGSKIILKNGVKACNVFWVVEAAIVLGANSVFKGMLLSNGAAVAAGANCTIEGRMFTTAGDITSAADFIVMPDNCSYINLGVLGTFVMFTTFGAIDNTSTGTITGNVGSNSGLITGFEIITLNGTIYTPVTPATPTVTFTTVTQVENDNKVFATFGIYQNGVLIPSSTKSLISSKFASNISLQTIATVDGTQPIEVRWNSDSDKITMGNRTLTVLKIQ
jgi:hypothetical protein